MGIVQSEVCVLRRGWGGGGGEGVIYGNYTSTSMLCEKKLLEAC